MKIVNNTPNALKDNLKSAISTAVENYITENELFNKHFSRNRILTMDGVINLLLSMQGGSLKKELYDAGISATASAFVQQRNKFSWMVLEDVLECFNLTYEDRKTYKGYRMLAVDGTTINIAKNPKSSSYVKNDSIPKGYNQLHVNPL